MAEHFNFSSYPKSEISAPVSIPAMLPTKGSLPLYNERDWFIKSPRLTYVIAPPAVPRHIAEKISDIPPKAAPKKAPTPIGIPERIVIKKTFKGLILPTLSGIAIAIPSGISCKSIAKDKVIPVPALD